ncbi:MAG TPA: DNA/RNA nuclease SfsA [Peptococcaceae bacterium]|nr:DNA/RNA nuclease SfsA [Peptococcaceae bacterium]
MRYEGIKKGIFLERPNRFIAYVEIEGQIEVCHVKNTGRCRELLISGAKVIVQESSHPGRKTKYDLIAVWKGERLINIDSQAPNVIFREWLSSGLYFPDLKTVKSEQKYGNSRFDYYLEAGERKIFVEVKGVTLEQEGVALFPDAPTLRGVKHLQELATCMEEGYEAMVIFIIQMKGIRYMAPNDKMHPEFGDTLRELFHKGAQVLAIDCQVTENEIIPDSLVQVKLNNIFLSW